MVEALVIVLSLNGGVLGTIHLGEDRKLFDTNEACQSWFDTDEGSIAVVDVSASAKAIFPVPIQTMPACWDPNEKGKET
jgi:hypothetical protein